MLTEISLSPKPVCFTHVKLGKGKPSALQVKLAVTPLKVESAGGISSTITAGPKSKTKRVTIKELIQLAFDPHVITVKVNEVF